MSTVLIVDDSDITRGILENILITGGYEVVGEAIDGQQAFEEYKRLSPDIVTMDISMSGVNGVDALKMIIEYNPRAVVVMCSAVDEQSLIVEALSLGAKEFIVKPFQSEGVLKAMANALRR